MPFFARADIPVPVRPVPMGHTRHIVGFVYFTFICYVSVGLPIAVLPPFVHLRMGYSVVVAGLMIGIQNIATVLSRFWSGRICDHMGAKVSVLWGMAWCTASGALLVGVAALNSIHWLSFAVLIASRLVLGVGESLASTGSSVWGIGSAGSEHTGKVIGLNGISIYCGVALAAPLGVILNQRWGLASIGAVTIVVCAVSFAIAWRKSPVAIVPGEHFPFIHVMGRVMPYGMALALGSIGYCIMATFVTLFYASRHWNGAALCLTAYGMGYIAVRLLFINTISRHGGFPVTMVSLLVACMGMLMIWGASAPWMVLSGAAINGLGFSLVFPALGVELVKRLPESTRGTVIGIYTAFFDVSLVVVGPVAGAIIGAYGYASAFLFALVCLLVSLGITMVLYQQQATRS